MKKLLSIIAVAMVAIAVNAQVQQANFVFSNSAYRASHPVVNQTLTIKDGPITFYAEDKTVQSEVVKGLEYGSDYLHITQTKPLVRVTADEGYEFINITFALKESGMGDVYGLQHYESIFGSEDNNMAGRTLNYSEGDVAEYALFESGVREATWSAETAKQQMQVKGVYVTYKSSSATALDNASDDKVAVKKIHNGQFLIFREGVRYNALGTIVE